MTSFIQAFPGRGGAQLKFSIKTVVKLNYFVSRWRVVALPDSVEHGDHSGEKRLDLAFADKALRYICESQVRARKELGDEVAAQLHSRLADIEAIDAITELTWVPMTLGPTTVDIEFYPGFRLIAAANEVNPPLHGNTVDWTKVERLLLEKLERA
jgi:hypothetical protein